MLRRIRQPTARGFVATLVGACLLAASGEGRAQQDGDYQQPVHVSEDEVALSFIQGRFATPITCKRTDGSSMDIEEAIVLKSAPESGGGDSVKITFFGIDAPDVAYCYNLVERRALDRRGTIFVHFRSHNRKDLGVADFRRAATSGPLTYNAHRGELHLREIGSEAKPENDRVLSFDGGDARVVVDAISAGSDGAKLLADYEARVGGAMSEAHRRFAFRFIAKDGTEFMFYGVEDARRRK